MVRRCPDCRALIPTDQWERHRQAHRNASKLPPEQRGYGTEHRRLRAQWAPLVARGTVVCARGEECLLRDRPEGPLILPGEDWELGHEDLGGAARRHTGPEHFQCNRATAHWRAVREAAENAGNPQAT